MRTAFYLLLTLIITTEGRAQDRKTFKINPGEKVVYMIPFAEKYSFPQFEKGTVNFRNGRYAEAPMNYNSLFGEMQFIDPKGDTLSIADPAEVANITFASDTFYFNKGYLQVLERHDGVVLAEKKVFDFVNRQKIGGMGEVSSASIDTYTAISSASIFKDLVAKEILTLGRYSYLYIGDAFGNFVPLTKKSLVNAYSRREKEVSNYLKEHNINLTNLTEVQAMLQAFNQ